VSFLTKEENLKKILKITFIIYAALGLINALFFFNLELDGVGERWIVEFGNGGFLGSINPMTLIMSFAIIAIVLLFAKGVKFERIPGRKQSLVEMLFEYFWEIVEDTVPVKKYRKITFVISMSLFIYITLSNILGGIPGVDVIPLKDGLSVSLFTNPWYSPTSDLNVNLTYAILVLILSHALAINHKGIGGWLKSFIQPVPFLLPLNIISEIAKPISHSLRLFGNIMGGGILVLIISYMLKYFVIPVFLWGFFGWFVGFIQAFVFALLTIAYIGSVLE
jgi:F-type H+-transporting ATPase subunit a